MKEETKTCLQPDEQPFVFASFELNCFNTCTMQMGKGEKNQNSAFFFFSLLSGSQIDMLVPYSPAVTSRMSAGTQASRHMGLVEAGKRPSAQWGRVIITQNAHAHATNMKTVEKQGFVHGIDKEDGKKRVLIQCLNCVQRAKWGIYWHTCHIAELSWIIKIFHYIHNFPVGNYSQWGCDWTHPSFGQKDNFCCLSLWINIIKGLPLPGSLKSIFL